MAGDLGPAAGEIEYRVYANDGAGGPLDLSMPWKTTRSGDRVEAPALTPGAHWRFLVRVRDLDLDREEQNRDARAELIVDGSGADVSARPRPVTSVSASAAGPGAIEVRWADLAPRDARTATGYRVWVQSGAGPVDFSLAPQADVAADGRPGRRLVVSGLTAGATHAVAVRAYNAAGEDGETAELSAAAGASSPATDAPQSLSASTSWRS